MGSSAAEITRLLDAARTGDAVARDALFKLVYAELASLAHRKLARESTLTDLDAASLVHEAYLRLGSDARVPGANRHAFLAYAAAVMRSVIVDYVRRRNTGKRGSGRSEVTWMTGELDQAAEPADFVDLDEAMSDLERVDERCHRVVELRFFAGLSVDEIAQILDISVTTVNRDWNKGRAFLYLALKA